MSFSKIVLNGAEVIRPVLLKIIPASVLSRMKAKVVKKQMDEFMDVKIEPFRRNMNPKGINLIGSIKSDTGLGQSMRLVAGLIEQISEPYGIYNYYVPPGDRSMSDTSYDYKISKEMPYNINLFHVNASEMGICFGTLGKKQWDFHYNIAYWLWELEEFPEEWMGAFALADEFWTPADFISNTLRKYTKKPVRTVPYAISAQADDKFKREYYNLPEDKFLFLMMYDSGSRMERKNPLAVIEAFKRAFPNDNKDVGLVIKINGEEREQDIQCLKQLLTGYDNIYFISEMLTKIQVNSLIKCVDAFVSLHRAEGFGLVLAEAMLLGTPAIATNWSANTEFMNDDVSCMVDFKTIEIMEDIPPFKKGCHWADANVEQAAAYMYKLFSDKNYYDTLKSDAYKYIKDKLSMERSSAIMKKRVEEINDLEQ